MCHGKLDDCVNPPSNSFALGLIEPGPVVLVTAFNKGRPQHHDDGFPHDGAASDIGGCRERPLGLRYEALSETRECPITIPSAR
jgi:hypothetical protein